MGTCDPSNHPNGPTRREDSETTLASAAPHVTEARQIGPYRLLQLIGEGGMGEVWLAEQKQPIHRTVALKLIKAGMDTKAVVARFESERQALALMDHPNIARVFDAGSTAEGRPYFVMEYVPGMAITEYCDNHRLTIKERLELFMQVCDGVQHAHQKAIIHRDLKPSNVLVVEQDNKAVPKIIDFGLAKATAQRLTDKTFFTELGVLMGTPEYMSPEQADPREQNIDTRTDVYSLGVILYELLVGALPFETRDLRAAGMAGILRVIREQEPPKPSTKIRSMGNVSEFSARNRKEEPRSFVRHLQGDLDWITMKALEKDRVRRYGSASEFEADISRYLRKEPVVAGPATAGYRIRKYVLRHRIALGAAAGLLVLLSGFVVAQAISLHRIKLERDRATRERDRANRITDFMTGMFKVSDPSEARGNNITAREILDKASKDIDTGLAQDPELQAQMMYVMGVVYHNLGLYAHALLLEQRSMEIRQRALGAENPDTLGSMYQVAWNVERQGHYAEAVKLLRQTLKTQQRVLGPEHPDTLRTMSMLGVFLFEDGHDTEAEALQRQAVDGRRRVLGPEHAETITSMGNLGLILDFEGKYAEAEKLYREVLEIHGRSLGPEHPETLRSVNDLANVLDDEGQYSEAEKLDQEALDVRRRVLGAEHPDTLYSMNALANVLTGEGRYDEAGKLFQETLDIRRRVLGPEHPDTAVATYNLGCIAAHRGQRDEALSLLRGAVDHGLPPYVDLRMDKDTDLKSLHGDPRFAALVAHAKERAAAAQKPNYSNP
jgi:eukaryotic-like serine/threonine-protein kinase